MRPIRYFTYQQTVWYNLKDYINLLLDTHTIWPARPALFGKRLRNTKSPEQVLLEKISRLNSVYQIRIKEEIYVDWVVFEHLYRFIKPYLVQSADWTKPDGLFRQTLLFINNSSKRSEFPESTTLDTYFIEIEPESST